MARESNSHIKKAWQCGPGFPCLKTEFSRENRNPEVYTKSLNLFLKVETKCTYSPQFFRLF
jgi:hypothetical protein